MKSLIGLISLSLLSGCAVFNPSPFSDYNSHYVAGKLVQYGKPCVLEIGDKKIIWTQSIHFKNASLSAATGEDIFYEYREGKLHKIEVVEEK
jgi:hypothetical protein